MIQTFLFDMDGTLVNTNQLILTSFQYTLDRYFPGQYTKEDLIPFIGEPLEVSFNQIDPQLTDEMVAVYREHNSRYHDQMVTEFPLVHETLSELKKSGCALGVVSTKKWDMVDRGLQLTGIDHYFDTLVTSDDVQRLKPDPEPIQIAMERLSADPERTLMIGDSPSDLLAGSRARVQTAAVSWSLKSRSVLETYHPDYWISQMTELLSLKSPAVSL
ncbi:MAG: pyrophosphatase PpaX [Sporolactobacillus sp.]